MTLADSLRNVSPANNGPRCTLCRIILGLGAADSAALSAALGDAMFTNNMIARALQAEGHDIREQSVGRHRRGICRGIE